MERTGIDIDIDIDIDITMVLTPEEQAHLFLSLNEIFESGWKCKAWEEKLKKKGGQR
ncbi:MAG: hypothetical protein Q7T70_18870 [Polaromonas sp.]|nr:hypothetical protein [Polaromonas sp.]